MWEGFLQLCTGKSCLSKQRFHVDSDLAFFFFFEKTFGTIKAEALFGDFFPFLELVLD